MHCLNPFPELLRQAQQFLQILIIRRHFFLALINAVARRFGNYSIVYCDFAAVCSRRTPDVFAEAPGPTEDKITPRIRNTASALWGVYAGLTILQIILLMVGGMHGFDAVCNSLSTLAAGGFSPNPESLMGYHSNYLTWVTLIFMFLAGASFNVQYRAIVQKILWFFLK